MLILSDDVVIINESDSSLRFINGSCLVTIQCGIFLQYLLIMTLKYGIVSQSTAVFPQSVENVVNTRSCMKKINTVIYPETGII